MKSLFSSLLLASSLLASFAQNVDIPDDFEGAYAEMLDGGWSLVNYDEESILFFKHHKDELSWTSHHTNEGRVVKLHRFDCADLSDRVIQETTILTSGETTEELIFSAVKYHIPGTRGAMVVEIHCMPRKRKGNADDWYSDLDGVSDGGLRVCVGVSILVTACLTGR